MSADDPIYFSRENRVEGASLRAIEEALEPWRITWIDGRSDVGRDGFVQTAEESPGGKARALAITCVLQAKATDKTLRQSHPVVLETRHVALWADELSEPTLIMLWSRTTRELRVRTAREVLSEIEISSPDWHSKNEVTVRISTAHVWKLDRRTHASMLRILIDELDKAGGQRRFHRSVRRILLTHIVLDKMATLHTVQFESADGTSGGTIYVGDGWDGPELDKADTDGHRILLAALMLYEQVWLPLPVIGAAHHLLGPRAFAALADSGRLVFMAPARRVGLCHGRGQILGGLLTLAGAITPLEDALQWTAQIERNSGHPGLAGMLNRALKVQSPSILTRGIAGAEHDLRQERICQEMGLRRPRERLQLPYWDREIFNRILTVNLARAVAQEHAIDVIDFESGMSWLSTLKLSVSEFTRKHETLFSLNAALGACKLPDIGALVGQLGAPRIVELAMSSAGQEFRDWYWEEFAPHAHAGTAISHQFVAGASAILRIDRRALAFEAFVRTSYLSGLGGPITINETPVPGALGFSRRTDNGQAALGRQASYQREKRRKRIVAHFGKEPGLYDACPCGLGEKYKFCCG
jgi:hypothetical protein